MTAVKPFSSFLACWSVFCFLFSISAKSQSQAISLDSATKRVSVSEFSHWAVDKNNVWLEKGIDSCRWLDGYQPYHRNAFVYQQFTGPPILRFTLNTGPLDSKEFVLHLRNTEIDRVQLLIIDEEGRTWKSKIIGDVYPFSERYIFDRILAIPFSVENDRRYTCYLGLEKKNRLISSIIEISERKHWEAHSSRLNLIYGLSMGTFLTFTLISFSLLVIIRQRLYLYYGLYILSVFLILFSIHGYSFRFFYPERPEASQYFMLLAQFLALIFGNLYAFRFIGFRHHLRLLNPFKTILISLYVLGIINTILRYQLSEPLERFFNYLFISTEVFNILFLFFFSLYYYLRFKVPEALVYFISFNAVGLAVLYTNVSFFTSALFYIPIGHSLILGLTVEILILAIYMIINYKSTENKRLLAESRIAEEKIKNQFAMITGQELEKRKIALNLHDNIGSSIILLKQKLEILNPKKFTTQLKILRSETARISREIRNISHELLPVTLEELGLVAATKELINVNGELTFHFSELTPTYQFSQKEAIQLYRILQELIKNSVQHAQAEHISIQFLTEPESFQLTYEDDGIGLDKSTFTKGLGFKSLETRVNMLKGSNHLESEPGKGVLVIIEVPLENHGFGDTG